MTLSKYWSIVLAIIQRSDCSSSDPEQICLFSCKSKEGKNNIFEGAYPPLSVCVIVSSFDSIDPPGDNMNEF